MSTLSPPPSSHFTLSLQNLGLGYAIALAFGFLVLFSALLLSSYLCCRRNNRRHNHHHHNNRHSSTDTNTIIVPRIFFVAEDDDDLENHTSSSSNGVVGLDRAVINSYPKFLFYKKNLLNHNSSSNNSTDNLMMCSICLCDYKDAEMLRMMPDCKHFFHLTCLDAWLKLNGSCPICRNSPLPTPVSTPLAEVVPLSHYPDNRRTSTVLSSS
ncbi:RING-H2 finger protein ATL68 [Bienertia sinuspersici]